MVDIIGRFRDSMQDFSKDALLKIIREGDLSDVDASASSPVGGIDLRPKNMPLKTSGENAPVRMAPIHLNDLDLTTFSGFTPVIINIIPINSIYMILGDAERNEAEKKELSYAY